MNRDPVHLVFAGGGTGGHLVPGLAVAERIIERMPDARITLAGSGRPLERRLVAEAGFEHLVLPCRAMPRCWRDVLPFLTDNVAGYRAAGRFIEKENVAVVVGLGGYASVPAARAAAARDVPLILLEQNVAAGKATRWLSRRASLVCAAFAQTAADRRLKCPVQVTGNPIRKMGTVTYLSAPNRRLLILGGSGGARELNENVPYALDQIRRRLDGWAVLHQSGESQFEATAALYRRLDLPALVVPFVTDVPGVLAETDLAVSRAGGTTLAELAAAGVPAVLLPYPHAADDHQLSNARVFGSAGGSIVLDRRELSGPLHEHLAGALRVLLGDRQRRTTMSGAMHALAHGDAAAEVADLILQVVGRTLQRAGSG